MQHINQICYSSFTCTNKFRNLLKLCFTSFKVVTQMEATLEAKVFPKILLSSIGFCFWFVSSHQTFIKTQWQVKIDIKTGVHRVFCFVSWILEILRIYTLNCEEFWKTPWRNTLIFSIADELPLKDGRNPLNKPNSKEYERRNLQSSVPNQKEDAHESQLTPTTLAIAAPAGFLIICCSFLCPCLWARRKRTEHSVLSKDMHSSKWRSHLSVVVT